MLRQAGEKSKFAVSFPAHPSHGSTINCMRLINAKEQEAPLRTFIKTRGALLVLGVPQLGG